MRPPEVPRFFCCETFRQATRPGSDGDGYYPAIHLTDRAWRMARDAFRVRFCPFCGASREPISADLAHQLLRELGLEEASDSEIKAGARRLPTLEEWDSLGGYEEDDAPTS